VENNQSFLKTLCLILSTPSYLGGVLIKAGLLNKRLLQKNPLTPGRLYDRCGYLVRHLFCHLH